MNMSTWQDYADCWSLAEDQRAPRLVRRVTQEVVYRDPNVEVEGVAALGSYMEGFRHGLPGHRFEIRSVTAHHDRSLAAWQQLSATRAVVMDGVSVALHATDGRMLEIAGFFLGPPVPA